jgi:hypothetical protein
MRLSAPPWKSVACGRFHPARFAVVTIPLRGSSATLRFSASFACGLGHEVKPLAEHRRTVPRSAGIGRPDGVTLSFQVSRNNIEPSKSVFRRNLFAKDMLRA